MKKFAAALLLSSALALPAQADVISDTFGDGNWYAGAGIAPGLVFVDDADVSGSVNDEIKFDEDFGGLVSFGYKFLSNWRTELEYAYRNTDVTRTQASGAASGEATANTLMWNVLYDFEGFGQVTPYIGAGLGMINLDLENVTPLAGGSSIDTDENDFAYQGILGANFDVSENLDLFAQYQYLASELDFSTSAGSSDVDYDAHTVFVGLRYLFGDTTAPAPQPARVATPAPQPAKEVQKESVTQSRNFLIFYDWNKSSLTDQASNILRRAADTVKRTRGVTRIELTGHADTTGSKAYNDGLSKRRAATAKQELVRLGIPANLIATYGRGEEQLLVPTADGVMEPQNRRVEIIYSYKD